MVLTTFKLEYSDLTCGLSLNMAGADSYPSMYILIVAPLEPVPLSRNMILESSLNIIRIP